MRNNFLARFPFRGESKIDTRVSRSMVKIPGDTIRETVRSGHIDAKTHSLILCNLQPDPQNSWLELLHTHMISAILECTGC